MPENSFSGTKKDRRQRYLKDPVYRAAILERVKARAEVLKSNPIFTELSNTRKRVCDRRNQISIYLDKIRDLERSLMSLLGKRTKLERLWVESKKGKGEITHSILRELAYIKRNTRNGSTN